MQLQERGELFLHFPALDDEIRKAFLLDEFRPLEPFGQFLAYGLLDDARPNNRCLVLSLK